MNTCRILPSRRSPLPMIVIAFLLAVVGFAELHAQHQRAAGVFLGFSSPEKHVTWHGLADTTNRDSGFSIGAMYEIGLTEMFTLVLSPQYSEVSSHSVYQFPNVFKKLEGRVEVRTPPMHAIELPMCIRASISLGNWYPYISVGGFLGYAYGDEAYYHSEGYSSTDPPLAVVRFEELSTFFTGVQFGAGISLVSPGVSLLIDWTLNQHLTAPIDTDMLTWEAPLRAVWRVGIVFPLEGGAQ